MYVGTILKKDNSVETKTIKIELIKKNFDGKLSVVISFPSKQAAIDAYNSPEYQELTKKRWASTKKTNLIIMGLNK